MKAPNPNNLENISRKEWLKGYKNCRAKVYAHGIEISQYYQTLTPSGHFMCGEYFPLGIRCMYKKCPLLKEHRCFI